MWPVAAGRSLGSSWFSAAFTPCIFERLSRFRDGTLAFFLGRIAVVLALDAAALNAYGLVL